MKSYLRKKHIIVEILSYVLIWASIVISIIWSTRLPDKIATHFDASGNPDGYGSPYSFIVFPIIMLVTMAICSLILHFLPPSVWNMPVKVKPERAALVYGDAISMVVYMEFEFGLYSLFFTIISFMQKGAWMLPSTFVFMGLVFFTIILPCFDLS